MLRFFRAVQRWIRKARWERDLSEELEFHREMKRRELSGCVEDPPSRESAVRREMGNVTFMKEEARMVWTLGWLQGLGQDLRIEARQLRQSWAFALTTIGILALGIGMNAAIFTLLNGIVLRQLPLPSPDRLAIVLEKMPAGCCSPPSWLDQRDLRQQNHVFQSMAAFAYDSAVLFRSGRETRHLAGAYVTPDYFRTVGVQPVAGRVFDPSEGLPGRDNVVLLRDDFWRTQLGADPGILHRTVLVNGRKCNVVGILPASFRFPWQTSVLWAPLVPTRLQATERSWHGFPMIGRMKPGVTLTAAGTEMDAIMKRLARQYPDADADRGGAVFPLQSWGIGETRIRLLVLQCAALAVFLMTCANVASLLLARYASRRREYAVRAALGASRLRQIRQHLTESLALAFVGCALGALIAWGGVRFLLWLYQEQLPREFAVTPDWRLVLFTIGVTLTGAIAFGLTTAFHESAAELEQSLRDNNRAGSGRRGMRVRQILVMAQVACAVALLAGADELIQSFRNLTLVQVGVNPAHLLTMRVDLPATRYTSPAHVASFFQETVRRIQSLPGIQGAATINMLPVQSAGYNGDVQVEGLPPHSDTFYAEYRWITGDYFATMGIPIVNGRKFLPEELSGRNKAVIINQTIARTLWKTRNPVGTRIRIESPDSYTVVGVMRDVRQYGIEAPPRSEVVMALPTQGEPLTSETLIVRSSLPTQDLLSMVRRQMNAVDPESAIYQIKSMDDVISDSISSHRITATLLLVFAVVALLLAAFGIYGVVSYSVTERRREFAVRVALGAPPARLVRMVFRQSMGVVGIGLALGLAGVFYVTHLLEDLLYGTSDLDPFVLPLIIPILVAVAAMAVLIPAVRIVRVDPMTPLREA